MGKPQAGDCITYDANQDQRERPAEEIAKDLFCARAEAADLRARVKEMEKSVGKSLHHLRRLYLHYTQEGADVTRIGFDLASVIRELERVNAGNAAAHGEEG